MADQGPFRVKLTPSARRDLERCTPAVRQRLKAAIDRLQADPRPHRATRIRGTADVLRIRVGDYRVLYRVVDDRLLVLVIRVGHRRDVYLRFGR